MSQHVHGRVLIAAALLGALVSPARPSNEAPPIRLPAGFTLEVLADGLGAPRALAVDPAGTLLVSIPPRGQIVALRDRGAPRAVERAVVADGLQRPHGLAFRGGDLYVAETGRIVRFRYDPKTLSTGDRTVVVPDLPAGLHHWTRSIAFGPDGGLYVSVGSSCDICREADRRRAAVIRYNADGTGERVFATGLRNPMGLAFHPRTGVLWTAVNERDWRRGGAPPDYVTEVREGSAYGWPDCYAERGRFAGDPELRDRRDCRGLTLPTLELPPHSAPLGLAFASDGALFVALHGSRPELPAAGYKVVRIAFRAGRPVGVEDFATGWRIGDRVWGRPVDVVVGLDGALYVSDDQGGQVLRIKFPRQ